MGDFRSFIETYSNQLGDVKSNLKDKHLDIADLYHHFSTWNGSNAILKRSRIKPNVFDDPNYDDDWHDKMTRIGSNMKPDEKEKFISYMHQNDPAETPTWAHIDYQRIIKRNTWLVHFTNEPYAIRSKGFQYGTSDPSKLGLTTLTSTDSKKYGGYNFAFVAGSSYARHAAHDEKYGNHAVMFQSAGVEGYHYGDEENQVIFYGPHVHPNSIVILIRDSDEWCVHPTHGNRECLYKNTFNKVEQWVMNNYQQYQKQF